MEANQNADPSKRMDGKDHQKRSDDSNSKSVERAREAIRKLAGNLEQSIGEMMGSASKYGDALAGHQSAIENKIPKPKDEDFGAVLLNQLAEMQEANNGYRERLDEANAQIAKQKRALESLEELAFVDFLTKVPNRRALEKKFEDEAYRGKRYNQALSMAFVDIDHFKSLNDSYGHQVGDRVLRGIAMKMRSAIRQSDFLARYGGEEFAILLPATTVSLASTVAEKLRNTLAHSVFRTDGAEIRITVSVGVGEHQPDLEDFDQFIARVDAAMYQAKNGGRNRTVKAEPAPTS